MEYIKYIQDLEGVSRPVRDAEAADDITTLTNTVSSLSGNVTTLTNTVSSLSGNVTTLTNTVNNLSEKVDSLQSDMETVTEITLTASGWSSSSPYSQTVSVSGVTSSSVFDVGILYPSSCTRSNQKAISKAAALIYEITSQSGAVRFRATEKPTTDIPLGLKGVI